LTLEDRFVPHVQLSLGGRHLGADDVWVGQLPSGSRQQAGDIAGLELEDLAGAVAGWVR
jgi:hypothetical protein